MATGTYTLGVSEINIGDVGTGGTMGASLTPLGLTLEGSCSLTNDAPETTDFSAEEEDDPVLSVPKSNGKVTLEFEIMNPTPDNMARVFNGTASKSTPEATENDIFTFANTTKVLEQSITVKPRQGYQLDIARAGVVAYFTGGYKKGELQVLHVKATVLRPQDDATERIKLTKLAAS